MNEERLPPCDVDAEEAVLGSLLIDGETIHKIVPILDEAQDFYTEQNRLIYQACLSLYQRHEAIDQITVAQELARQGKLESCGGAAQLSHLISGCPTSLDIETHARVVYRLSVMRGLIQAGEQIARIGFQADPDVAASLSRAEDILFKLHGMRSGGEFVHIRQILDQYFETAAPREEKGAPSQIPHILSAFHKLDEFVGGFQRSDLVIVAGRPSMGKTSLALSLAGNTAVEQGACVAIFSLEMSREMLVHRMLANRSGVDSRRIHFGLHSEEEERKVMEAIGILSEAPIYIDDSPQLRVGELRSQVRRLHFEHPVDLVIVDHLGLLQADAKIPNRVQEIGYISRSLKAIARELNVPLMALSQLSRAPEGRLSHRPQLSDLRDSGEIEQDADLVMFIYRDEYYYKEEDWPIDKGKYPKGVANIILAKNRNGPTGEIDLRFSPQTARFEDLTTVSEEPSLQL
ncbi:MAG: replicative DNA helicase [Chloroflexota bacterium]